MLAAYTVDRWKALCHGVLQRPDLETDPRFITRQTRQEHHRALKAIIEEIFAKATSKEWLALCEEHDLMCAPINTYDDVVTHEQVLAREAIDTIRFPDDRKMETVAVAPKLSETPGRITSPYPEFVGQHTREILASIGLEVDEISKLEAEHVISSYIPA
jgi:crotonobetainyl-CoA:carnitine CoA-transferase CaiB-like acyl-CoA transferase